MSKAIPRLWGRWSLWEPGCGFLWVALDGQSRAQRPWLQVLPDVWPSFGTEQWPDTYPRNSGSISRQMSEEICSFLNGGSRPRWLDDFDRQTVVYAESLEGASVTARGPVERMEGQAVDWVDRRDKSSKMDRKFLMDFLFGSSGLV